MKKIFYILVAISLMLEMAVVPAHAAAPIDASAAIMVDASTGQVLYEQNANKKLPVASISKLLTAIVVEDEVKQKQTTGNSKVKINSDVAAIENDTSYSRIGLQEGESYTVRELLNAALVKSADGATLALSTAAGDSLDEFNMKMQQKAQQIGMKNYTIVNPVGLTNGDLKSFKSSNYSDSAENKMSASDVAILSRYLVNHYPQLLQVTSQKSVNFYLAKKKWKVENNLNKMLPGEQYAVSGITIDGLKTGTSQKAGACFVSTGLYRGHRIITVVLHANGQNHDARFVQTQRLYAMLKADRLQTLTLPQSVYRQKLADGINRQLNIRPKKVKIWETNRISHYTVAVKLRQKLLKRENVFKAPIKRGQWVGELEIFTPQISTLNGEPLHYQLYSSSNQPRGNFWQRLWH